MRQRLLDAGITMDLSRGTSFQYAFANGSISALPKLDFASASKLDNTFASATVLASIDEIVVHENLTYSNTFGNCTSLTYLRVSGTIGQNFDVSPCPLDHDSLMSIINALKSGVSSKTLTLGEANLAKLTDAEKAIATQKGWTLL